MGVFDAGHARPESNEETVISRGIANPIGSPRIRDMVSSTDRVLIVSDDNTRATPVYKILPHILEDLQVAGVPDSNIKFIIASGTHRAMSHEEKIEKLGAEVVARFEVMDHRWNDSESLFFLGKSDELGIEVWPNRALSEATFIIGVGIIIPHGVAGFSGGGKIITPGICGEQTNGDMHWAMVGVPPEEIFGVYDTPVRRIINDVAARVGLNYVVNTVLNNYEEVVHCVSGSYLDAHKEGARLCAEVHAVHLPERADIVVIDSKGCDIEYWQAIKSMTPGGLAMKDGGVVIHVCECREGVSRSHPEVLHYGYVPEKKVLALERDGLIDKSVAVHMVQASRVITDRGRGILVTPGLSDESCSRLGFTPAKDVQSALDIAFEIVGKAASVAVLRHAGDLLPLIGGDTSKLGYKSEKRLCANP